MKRPAFLLLAFLAFGGGCFCLFSLWDTSGVFCLNTGCGIYKGYEIFGLSFYWIGAFYFFLLGALALLPRARFWLRLFTAAGLLGNILFLGYQIFYWPCSSCLLVAALLGLFAFFLFQGAPAKWRRLFILWLLFFVGAVLGAIRDGVQPSPLVEREQPEIEIFFSASCPACKSLIENLLQNQDLFEKAALYPLLKSDGDRARMVFLKKMLDAGTSPEKAFKAFWEEQAPPALSLGDVFSYGPAFEKNKMVFARLGGERVPLIVSGQLFHGEKVSGRSFFSEPQGGCSITSGDSGACSPEGATRPFTKEW
ncbi:hypothetical protein LJC24_04270 [Desulfococcaceae bacterium OttesenSCG-928-F15]|nr:hypothetical protein [Desulfococcaceae bacterium OttesenSCG-928-F15]